MKASIYWLHRKGIGSLTPIYRIPFSIRETLLAPGDPEERFHRCCAQARGFIEETSIGDLLAAIFNQRSNRQAVAAVVRDPMHVGFIFPAGELTIDQLAAAAARAGFNAGYSTIASTVIARELGALANCARIPTMIFSAATSIAGGRQGFIEAVIPEADRDMARKWVEQEVGSHVGLTLVDRADFGAVHNAFLSEGFAVPSFMHGKIITNPGAGVAVAYYDRQRPAGTSRIEVLYPLGREQRQQPLVPGPSG